MKPLMTPESAIAVTEALFKWLYDEPLTNPERQRQQLSIIANVVIDACHGCGGYDMTREQVLDLLDNRNHEDMQVAGTHPTRNGLRFETLDTQAGMRIYYRLKAAARQHPSVKVACGETNNGTGRFFVRITGLEG